MVPASIQPAVIFGQKSIGRVYAMTWKFLAGVLVTLALGVGATLAPYDAGVTRIVSRIDIQRAPDVVFDYVTTPSHWPQWHPSSIAVSGATDHALEVGEQVQEEFVVAGRRGQVTWQVALREPARRWRIDGLIDGHLAGSVTYTLTAQGDGTHLVREFSYSSRNLFQAIVNWLTLRERIEAESAQALARLKLELESAH